MTDTWATLLETKENRIAVLERDCSLLEKELLQQQQQREQLLQTVEQQQQQLRHRSATPVNTALPARSGTPSSLQQQAQQQQQQSQQHYRNSPILNGPLGNIANKDAVIKPSSSLLLCLHLFFFPLLFTCVCDVHTKISPMQR